MSPGGRASRRGLSAVIMAVGSGGGPDFSKAPGDIGAAANGFTGTADCNGTGGSPAGCSDIGGPVKGRPVNGPHRLQGRSGGGITAAGKGGGSRASRAGSERKGCETQERVEYG